MDNFLISYRDPLFGILVFLTLVFIVSFFSYWWAYYKKREEDSKLTKFFKKFEESADEEITKIDEKRDTKKALLLLAKAFEKSGDFEKAIAIYLNLSKRENSSKNRYDILKKLGIVYFRAGFLEKSRDILLETLKFCPRDRDALKFLMVIYEKLQNYEKAFEVLESLGELTDVSDEEIYFKILDITKNRKNENELFKIYENYQKYERLILDYLFKNSPKRAWEAAKRDDFKKVIDILWRLNKKDVDFEIVKRDDFLSELYSAKGYVDFKDESSIFELDVLLKLKERIADLEFEYLCQDCKNIFPIPFSRCPKCLSTKTPKVELILTKRRENEKSISF